MKRGFEFTLMVVGKNTLLGLLLFFIESSHCVPHGRHLKSFNVVCLSENDIAVHVCEAIFMCREHK